MSAGVDTSFVGDYAIARELGAGGVGRVVEGVHTRTGKRVAIKMLLAEKVSAATQRLLLDEAAVVVQLSHPNVVELIDVGRDRDGSLFLVMELVDGSHLGRWVRRTPTIASIFRVCDEMLDALAAAHAQGVVHGDLKPANVLLDMTGRVKITDFGIARVIDPLRRSGERGVTGTPHYMSPEQLFAPDEIGPPTDLYAIGVMLRDMLGPAMPRETFQQVLERKVSPPHPFVARNGVHAPSELAALLDALLRRDPRQRPRFAAQVRRELAMIAKRVTDSGSRAPISEHATIVEATVATSAPSLHALAESHLTIGASSAPLEATMRRLRPVPLVGRRDHIELLTTCAREASEGDGPRAVVLIGRAGEGKSRIARHGFAMVERQGTMLGAAASFDESGGGANVDLRECLRRLLGAPQLNARLEDTLASRWQWLGAALGDAKDLAGELHQWLSPDAHPIDADRAAALAASALCVASSIRPTYLWLDDVGWSRDGALPLVTRLLDTSARVLVVATMRSGTADHPRVRGWVFRVSEHPRARVRTLAPLADAERSELLQSVASIAKPTADELASRLHDPTLVIVEAARDWSDQGLLVETEDGFVPRADVSLDALAGGVRGVIARRLDGLLASFGERAPHAERVLMHAALLGVHFERRALVCCCDDVDVVLDRALMVGMLRVIGPEVYRFDHQLFAEALFERVDGSPDAADIAHVTAIALGRTYGSIRPEMGLRAMRLHRRAGALVDAAVVAHQVISAYAHCNATVEADAAIAELERNAEEDAAPPDAVAWGHIHHAKGVRLYYALEYEAALARYRHARAIFERHGESFLVARVIINESSTLFYLDRLRDTEQLLAMLATLPAGGHPFITTRSHHRLAELASLRGDLAGAIAHQRDAERQVDFTDASNFVAIVATLGALLMLNGDVEEAARAIDRVHSSIKGATRRDLIDIAPSFGALSALVQGRFADALPFVDAWLAATSMRKDRWHGTEVRAQRAACLAATGTDEAAAEATRELMRSYRDVPHDELQTWWAIRVAESLLRGRGMHALARELGTMLDARMATIAERFAQ